MRMRCSILAAGLALLSLAAPAAAQSATDQEEVRQAVLDYVEGFYEGDTTRFVRSVRPEVDKYGFWKGKSGVYEGAAFPWTNFHDFARKVREGKIKTPADAPKVVTVFEVQDQTASAKVEAYWGTDYFLLARYDGHWMIRHIMWQDPPVKR